jgi:3-ketoacyl-CoA synthase
MSNAPAALSANARKRHFSTRLLGGKMGYDIEEFCERKKARHSDCLAGERIGHVDNNIFLYDPKSFRIRMINWWHVFFAEYLYYVVKLSILGLCAMIFSQLTSGTLDDDLLRVRALASDQTFLEVAAVVVLVTLYFGRTKPPVYCIENVVFVPPKSWQVTKGDILTMMRAQGCFTEDSIEFSRRLLDRSGTGEKTHWPPSMVPSRDGVTKATTNVEAARDEAKAVIFPLVKELLERTGILPEQIDILIINCSLFTPTPSLCALVCNEFCLREDVRTYNLGGMGCSANVISIDLAKELLENRPGARALVISTENLTQNLYTGNEKSMLLQNTLFRCGGCAQLLSSRRRDFMRAKYKLLYTFRAQVTEDNSYSCVFQRQDFEGQSGISLSKDIVSVAGRAMKRNFTQLGPHVLPMREQFKVAQNQLGIYVATLWKKAGWPLADRFKVPKGYMPNFSKGIDHFCIHAGGRAVIEGVQKNLGLRDDQIAPSVQTLSAWGNTSSSSIWYEADWIERFGRLRRGDRILQIAFGSGFKCNSAVWIALRVDASKCGVSLQASDSPRSGSPSQSSPSSD